jgi:hypothetical protein
MTDEKPIELDEGDIIEYQVLDDTPGGGNLGRAEFVFCPILKRGRITEVNIYRKQQRRKDRWFRVKMCSDQYTGLAFEHRTGEYRTESLAPWHIGPCKEHKGLAFSVYVPTGTGQIRVRLSSISTSFVFEPRVTVEKAAGKK